MLEDKFFSINKPQYLQRDRLVDFAVRHSNSKILVALNSDKLILNEKNTEFVNLCNANICYFDGVGAAWAHNRKYSSGAKKIAGVELYLNILEELANRKIPVALIGGPTGLVEKSQIILQAQIPSLQIVASSNGYIDLSSWDSVINDFKEAGAGYVIAAMGSPRQEKFLLRCLNTAGIGGMGVGGSLKVLVGEQQRAPKLFRNLGLEFLYRYVASGVQYYRIKADLIFAIRTLIGRY
jgi:exopolysaccharide biosynthesis WecB/TagA/CpsF family protein